MAAVLDNPAPYDRLEEPDRLPDGIDEDTLRKYFTLTGPDLVQVDQCRGPANKFGFAVQLCTLRWRGYFLPDTRDVASSVIEMIGSQLGLLPISLADYPQNEKTRFEHLERIRQHLGFVRCDRLETIRRFRNRIAHHEAILTSRNEVYTGFIDHPAMTSPAILACVTWVSPPTADWLRTTTRYHQAIAPLAEVAGSDMVL